jgi:hypothetical protein
MALPIRSESIPHLPVSRVLRRLLTVLAALLFVGAAPPGHAATVSAPAPLAAHRAFYRLTLDSTENSGVTSASGAMEYAVIDGCEGWATQQRMDITVLDREGGDTHTVSDYSTWESKDGRSFRFRIAQSVNDNKVVRAGYAELVPGHGGFAVYTQPTARRVVLPAHTVFPMAQTAAVLAAARRGDKFVSLPVFDGTAADAVENSFTVITAHGMRVPTNFAPLRGMDSDFVHIGYFDTDRSQQLPGALLTMRYWDNGVADQLVLDFGNFTVNGTLDRFELLPHHC